MKTKHYLRTSALALTSLLAAAGCAQKETDAPMPRVGQTATSPTATSGLARAKEAWSAFVSRVEGGGALDPLKQYVSKATQVANGDGKTARPMRPKYDAAQPEALPKSGQAGSRYPADEVPCDGGGGGGYYPPAVTSTFVSSEGVDIGANPTLNPNNYIVELDLEVSTSSSVGPHPGSSLLRLDLNKGAGGKYIYLTFTRGQNLTPGVNYGQLFLTRITAQTSNILRVIIDQRGCPDYYHDVINGNHSQWIQTNFVDLNDGAGGKFIYAYQSNEVV